MQKFKEMVEAKLNGESAKDLVSGIKITETRVGDFFLNEARTRSDGPKVHDVRHMDDLEVYDYTHIDDNVKHGDVLRMSGGRTAILDRIWPIMVNGDSDTLHTFKDGIDHATEWSNAGLYSSYNLARSLKGK